MSAQGFLSVLWSSFFISTISFLIRAYLVPAGRCDDLRFSSKLLWITVELLASSWCPSLSFHASRFGHLRRVELIFYFGYVVSCCFISWEFFQCT
jgi:heme/copper-type cytochrome/quinol oxidase subunit 3